MLELTLLRSRLVFGLFSLLLPYSAMSIVGAGSFAFSDGELSGPAMAGNKADAKNTGVPTIAEFAVKVGVKAELAKAVAEALGVTDDTTMEDFAFLDEEEYKTTLNSVVLNENPLNPMMKAQAMRLYHQARTQGAAAGLPVPGVILPSAAPQASTPTPRAEPEMLKQSAYLDQGSEGTFPLMNPGDLQKYRSNYHKIMGVEPPLNQRPTDEQLSALLALLATGRAPFADFAVFGPFDGTQARLRKYTDQVFVDGKLQTRLLHGPSTFEAWQGCWGVFKAAMLMLDAASLGSLNQYEEGLRQLTTVYKEWSCIARAEATMRATQWAILLEEVRRTKPTDFDEQRPWDFVIGVSSFGVEHGMRAHWWWLHVTGPLSTSGSSAAAMSTADRIDGRTTVNEHVDHSKKQRTGKGSNSHAPHPVASAIADTPCYPWNDGLECSEPCSRGRKHACKHCGGAHRGKDCWQKGSKKGGGKANNGGNDNGGKGGNGKKKSRKNKKKASKGAGKSSA